MTTEQWRDLVEWHLPSIPCLEGMSGYQFGFVGRVAEAAYMAGWKQGAIAVAKQQPDFTYRDMQALEAIKITEEVR